MATLTGRNVVNAGSSYQVGVFKTSSPIKDLQAVVPCDSDGTPGVPIAPSLVTGNLSNYTSSALEASKIVSAVPCKLFVISGFSTLASDQYIHIFNSATLPANGTKPDIVLYASAGSTFGYTSPALYGRYFSTGLVICNSTTLATKTLGAANCSFDVQYLT